MAKAAAKPPISAAQAAAFRLARQHLSDPRRSQPPVADIVDVVRDTGGIQAQAMSAAEIALDRRVRDEVEHEAGALGTFLGVRCAVRFSA